MTPQQTTMSQMEMLHAKFGHSTEEMPIPLVRRRVHEVPRDDMVHETQFWSSPLALADPWDGLIQDERSSLLWQLRRPRRIAIRVLGWVAVGALFYLAAKLIAEPNARRAMWSWITLDQADVTATMDRRGAF